MAEHGAYTSGVVGSSPTARTTMKFFIIPFLVLIVCEGIKLAIYFLKGGRLSSSEMIWEVFWVGKFPSSHSAVISSSLYLLYTNSKDLAVVSFALFISLIILYGLVEDKKRHKLFEYYAIKSNDKSIQAIVRDGKLGDFNGHSIIQILAGIVLGIGISTLFY